MMKPEVNHSLNILKKKTRNVTGEDPIYNPLIIHITRGDDGTLHKILGIQFVGDKKKLSLIMQCLMDRFVF